MRIELSPKLPTHDIAMEGCYAACIEHYLLCQAIVAGVAAPGDLSKPVGWGNGHLHWKGGDRWNNVE